MNKLFVFFLLLLSLLASCKQVLDETEVEGRVIDIVTGQPVAGETVQLWEDENCLTPDGCGSWSIEEVTTDSTGHFSFRFDAKALHKWQYFVYIPEYGNRYVSVDQSLYTSEANPFIKHQSNSVDLKVCPKAYVWEYISNVNTPSETDTLYLKVSNPAINWSREGYKPGLNPWSMDTPEYRHLPYGTLIYQWRAVKGGQTTSGVDTIHAAPGSYQKYELYY